MRDIVTPSDVVYTPKMIDLVRQMVLYETVCFNDVPITLHDGSASNIYVEARSEVILHPDYGQTLTAPIYHAICQRPDMSRRPAVIGVPAAGTCLAMALHGIRSTTQHMVAGQVMRENKKAHGRDQGWVIGGCRQDRFYYFILENTINRGDSLIDALEHLREDGFDTSDLAIWVLIDRCQGGLEKLQKAGYRVHVAYQLPDILHVIAKEGLWPEAHIEQALREFPG